MSENVPPSTSADAAGSGAPGKPYYEKATAELQVLLRKQAASKAKLAKIQDTIHTLEGDYLENTPNGNIIVGFDNYTKGTGAGAGASRRRGNAVDNNRVFSGSDITYNPNAVTLIPTPIFEVLG
jgi:chromatin modification-related protein EAF6